MDEILIQAIDDDGEYFAVEKLDAHVTGVFHAAISIFVFDGDKLLLQRRAMGKYHSGGLWANTVCTHPNWGETAENAATRRLIEELGFSVTLVKSGTIEYRADVGAGLIENERVTVFIGKADASRLEIKPDPDEVMDTCWATLDEIRERVHASPHEFTAWIKIYMDELEQLFPKSSHNK